MKKGILLLLIASFSLTVFAQKPDETEVPEDVIEYFNRKYSRAEDVVWDTIHRKNYIADFLMDDMRIKAEFSPQGEWIQTTEIMDEKNIYRPVQNFIENEYPGSDFIYGEIITRADRENSYYVKIEEKIKGVKEVPPTELFFDKTGRFEKVISPEIPLDTDEENVEEVDVYVDDFDKVVENDIKETKKEKKEKKKKKNEDDESGIYERQKVDPRSLPTPIMDYVMDNFDKLIEFKIKSAEYLENEELGLHYYLVIAKEGLNQPESELFFTITGEFINRIDPPEMVQELEEMKEEEEIAEEEVTAEEEEILVPAVDVPEAVTSYFSRRFPRAEEIVWEAYGDENFMARFWYRDTPTKTEFAPDGTLISTITEMDSKNIYGPAQRYIDQNYPDYKVDYGEKAIRKDRNHYYYVLIYTKKKKVEPKEIELYFDKAGRIMEELPEFLNK